MKNKILQTTHYCILCLVTACFSLAHILHGQFILPFEADFELSDGYSLGPLNGQSDTGSSGAWTATLSVDITNQQPYDGLNILMPSVEETEFIGNFQGVNPGDTIFLEMRVKPIVAANEGGLPQLSGVNSAALTGFVDNGQGGANLYYVEGDGTGGGTWISSSATISTTSVSADEYHHLVVRLDYTEKKYDLYFNGVWVVQGVAFIDSTLTSFSQLKVKSDGTADAHIDAIRVAPSGDTTYRIWGSNPTNSGYAATAWNYGGARANGDHSTAWGIETQANAFASTALGQFNVGAFTNLGDDEGKRQWFATDPLFEIGNGTDAANRSNALTVLKNGNVGIGEENPGFLLHVDGDVGVDGGVRLGNTASTEAGMIRYSNNAFEGYNGTEWVSFTNDAASSITNTDISNWNAAVSQSTTAFDWGDHSSQGYLKADGSQAITGDLSSTGDITTSGAFQTGGYRIEQKVHTYNYSAPKPPEFITLGVFGANDAIRIIASDYGNEMGGGVEFYISPGHMGNNDANVDRIAIYSLGDSDQFPNPEDDYQWYVKRKDDGSYYLAVEHLGGNQISGNHTAVVAFTVMGESYQIDEGSEPTDVSAYTAVDVRKYSYNSSGNDARITDTQITNWDQAYSWGDHASAGYLKLDATDGFLDFNGTNSVSGEGAIAWGINNDSNGTRTTAWGASNDALGWHSTAWGASNSATGNFSTAWGLRTAAEGASSSAWGMDSQALGTATTAMGEQTIADSYSSTAVGRFNVGGFTDNGSEEGKTQWFNNDPLFEIGNGTVDTFRKNALTVLKNGKVGIGLWGTDLTGHSAMLRVAGSIESTSGGFKLPDGTIIDGAEDLGGGGAELDPVFTGSLASGITQADIDNWNAAHSWGDHATGAQTIGGQLRVLENGNMGANSAANYNNAAFRIGSGTTGIAFDYDRINANAEDFYFQNSHGTGQIIFSTGGSDLSSMNILGNGMVYVRYELEAAGGLKVGDATNTTFGAGLIRYNAVDGFQGYDGSEWLSFTSSGSNIDASDIANWDTAYSWGDHSAAGYLQANSSSSVAWGDQSVASNSFTTAWGEQSTAIGDYSTAWGSGSTTNGDYATAWGEASTATGMSSTVWGALSSGIGDLTTAFGMSNTASGQISTVWGFQNLAESYVSTALGRFNVGGYTDNGDGDSNNDGDSLWLELDPLFEVGNGVDAANRSNAFTILKNGQVGIGFWGTDISDHNATLRVAGEIESTSGGFKLPDGTVIDGAEDLGGTGNDARITDTQIANWDTAYSWGDHSTAGYLQQVTTESGFGLGWGHSPLVTGDYSVALGVGSAAHGDISFALGGMSFAVGDYSVAMGSSSSTGGQYSVAIGRALISRSYASAALGHYNIGNFSDNGTPGDTSDDGDTNWIELDPLFEVGNGVDAANRSNAFTILKNGQVGIGLWGTDISDHNATLRVAGEIESTSGGFKLPDGTVIDGAEDLVGPVGPAGPEGPAGVAGVDGATWSTGAAAPDNANGNNGDLYLDTSTGDYYVKASDDWGVALGNLKGADGADGAVGPVGPEGPAGVAGVDGATWSTGAAVPDNANGNNGDLYLDTSTGDYYVKASDDWGVALGNLKGADGADGAVGAVGPVGPEGPAGAAGVDGATWSTGAAAPDNANGNNGDLYLDTSTGNYYVKASDDWGVALGNLKGADGADGAVGPVGPAGPTGPAGASPFGLNGSDAYFTTGNVGIGTDTPDTPLHVVGQSTLEGDVTVTGDLEISGSLKFTRRGDVYMGPFGNTADAYPTTP